VLVLHVASAFGQIQPKPATDFTAATNAAMYQVLDFSNRQDFADASQGFIAGLEPPRIIYNDIPQMNALKYYAWDMEDYQFLNESNAPPSVNPSLWRQERLNNLNGLFEVKAGQIYQVRSYEIATMSFIKTDNGWIVLDPLSSRETARAGLALLRSYVSQAPVVAIISSHSHLDHFGGVDGILQAEGKSIATDTTPAGSPGKIPYYAPSGFYDEALSENLYLGNSMLRRSDYMYGSYLAKGPLGQVGSGLGKTTGFGASQLYKPTLEITQDGPRYIDGLQVTFQLAPNTEAPAEMHMFFNAYNALCLGENVTHTMHNLLTSRGAKVRDPRAWAQYLDAAIDLFGPQTEVLLGVHNWPVWGNARCLKLMRDQRDMYRFFNDQVIRMINDGMNMEEIAEAFQLPTALDGEFYNRGYYGTINHNVKAVVQRYVGWWDGNPANYFKYPDEAAAQKYVEFMGGESAVIAKARQSYDQGDYRWVAEVMKHVVFANPTNQEAKNLQADAFEQLGYSFEAGTWRNIFLSGAEELRNGTIGPPATASPTNTLAGIPPTLLFDYFGTLLKGKEAEALALAMRFRFTDTNLPPTETDLFVQLNNGVLHCKNNKPDEPVGTTYTLSVNDLLRLFMNPTNWSSIQVQGDPTAFSQLAAHFDNYNRLWNIVLPLGYANSRSNKVNQITLTAPQLQNNALIFSVVGIPGHDYFVNASTNLKQWQVLATNTSPFTVTNYLAPGEPQKFFRVTYSP
jgi:alkyl sulfatase BDS1-like metallo-beta-lactamase superfamily hydrolase